MSTSEAKLVVLLSAEASTAEWVAAALASRFSTRVFGQAPDLLLSLRRSTASALLVEPMGAFDLADLLRAVATLAPALPVLLLCRDADEAEAALRAGADDVVFVPTSPAALCHRVELRCRRGAAQGGKQGQGALGDPALARDLRLFLEQALRQFVALEHELLSLKEQTGALSSPGGSDPGRASEYRLLLVHPDASLVDALRAALPAGVVTIEPCFTGGGALDQASALDLDGVVCGGDLADIDAATVASSLKSELPHIDAIELCDWGSEAAQARWVGEFEVDTGPPVAARSVIELAALVSELAARRTRRSLGRRLARVFKQKHSDFVKQVSSLQRRLG